jgi:DNA-binding CsgD family transcriptional regulator
MPHVQRASRAYREMHRLERKQQLLEKAIDRLAIGIFVVDANGQVIVKNSFADCILAQRDGLHLESDGIHSSSQAAERLLRHVAQGEDDIRRESPSVIYLPRRAGRRELRLVPLGVCANGTPCSAPDCSRTFYVTDPDQEFEVPEEAMQLFHLSPGECALARELLRGHSVESAAAQLSIRTETARGRLKKIFFKTGTNRQSDLMRLLLSHQTHFLLGAPRNNEGAD